MIKYHHIFLEDFHSRKAPDKHFSDEQSLFGKSMITLIF